MPAAAVADPAHGHVMYVFKGSYDGGGVVTVDKGNGHVKKAGLAGQDVQFALSAAKLDVADTNVDGSVTVDELVLRLELVVRSVVE